MDGWTAVVVIFGMFFAVIVSGIASHHRLETIRIESGFYNGQSDAEEQDSAEIS